ncbi:glycosyltransferase [Alicyclobacillus curvatus]|nr:glycosyltransferase [Alicyclobacillus curvatus]
MFAHDCFSKLYESQLGSLHGWRKIYKRIQKRLISRHEKTIFGQYNTVMFVSKTDMKYSNELLLAKNANYINLGVRLEPYTPGVNVLFVGNYSYPPNVEAAMFFANTVMPLVVKQAPETKFIIAGKNPPREILSLIDENYIEVTGFLENISEAYMRSDIVVSPLLSGSGMKNKVLEAMDFGKPMVISPLSREGIDELVDRENCLIADDIEDWVRNIVELVKKQSYRESLGRAAKGVLELKYNWETNSKVFIEKVMV